MSKPIVAIVGRPNVGKSMLFNKLIGQRLSIVEDTPGVTRDRIYGECEWCGRKFTLVDTGGIEPRTDSQILTFMREQAQIAIENATVIIFLTDIKTGRDGLRSGGREYAAALAQADRAGGQQDGLRRRAESRITTSSTTSASATLWRSPPSTATERATCSTPASHYFPDEEEAEEESDVHQGRHHRQAERRQILADRTAFSGRSALSSPTSRARRATPSTLLFENETGKYVFIDTAGMRTKVQGRREHRKIQRAARAPWPSTARTSASS